MSMDYDYWGRWGSYFEQSFMLKSVEYTKFLRSAS
jgi:hypothetical protein